MVAAPEVQTQRDAAAGLRAGREGRDPAELLTVECRAGAKAGRWAEVEQLAADGAAAWPEDPFFPVQRAWAAHQQGRTAEALEIAEGAAERFSRSAAAAYAAACLNGALLRIPEARGWLNAAIERASNPDKVKLRSLTQPELQTLWSEPQAGWLDES